LRADVDKVTTSIVETLVAAGAATPLE